MEIIFYANNSPNNQLIKDITLITRLNGQFRNEQNILNPEIIINNNISGLNANYCYIADFQRYYFISNLQIIRKDLLKVSLNIDVLMSYSEQIKECYAKSIHGFSNIDRYSNSFNEKLQSKFQRYKYIFNNPFNENGNFVMIAVSNSNN